MKSYFISFNGVDYSQFYPSNDPKVIWKPEAGEIFMRYSVDELSVPRTTNTVVYDTLESYFFDDTKFGTTLHFKIKKSGVDKYFFRMSVNEGKIDTEKKVFKCTPRTNDNYQDIMDVYDKTFTHSGVGFFGLVTNFLMLQKDPASAVFTQVGIDAGWAWADSGGVVIWNNAEAVTEYARKLHTGDGVNGYITKIVITAFTGNSFNMYLADTGGSPLSNTANITGTGIYNLVQNSATDPDYIYGEFAAGNSGTFNYIVFTPDAIANEGALLSDLIDRILNHINYMNLSYDVVSTYLWNSALGSDPPPNIKTYITANPTKDYVVEETAIWNKLIMVKTDTFTVDSQTSHSLTFKNLMDFLKIKLRAWWYIDADGKFRIEHEKYFTDYITQLDITAQYKAEIDQLIYNYDKGDIVSTINYREDNQNSVDFVANPIIYDSILTTPAAKDIILSLSTDAEFIVDIDNSVDNTGFTLLQCAVQGANYYVDINVSEFDAAIYYANQRLSWAYLFKNYWNYFGEADSANINNGDTLTLVTVKRFLKQEGIKFYYSGELLWYKPVTLKNGLGWMTQWEESEDEYLTINVGFDPYL